MWQTNSFPSVLCFFLMYHLFREVYQPAETSPSEDVLLDVGEGTIKFTAQWLLNQLVVYSHRYTSFKCIHKKVGMLLFRKGGDTLLSLYGRWVSRNLVATMKLNKPY